MIDVFINSLATVLNDIYSFISGNNTYSIFEIVLMVFVCSMLLLFVRDLTRFLIIWLAAFVILVISFLLVIIKRLIKKLSVKFLSFLAKQQDSQDSQDEKTEENKTEHTFKEIAKILVENPRWQTYDPKILKLKDKYANGNTVAHYLAYTRPNWLPQDKDILKLKDDFGWTVAHILARYNRNWNTEDEEILNLKTNDGSIVKEILDLRNQKN